MYGFKEIDAPELKEMLDKGEAVQLVDVRTPAEVARGIIPGAKPLPLTLLPINVQEIDREKPVIFYCQAGGRSAQAAAYMANQGIGNVFSLRGGIAAWARSGYPMAAP